MKQGNNLWEKIPSNKNPQEKSHMQKLQGLWTNILGMILSLCFFGWGYLSLMSGLGQGHHGPVISGSVFILIGSLTFGGFLASTIIKIFRR